MHYNLEFIREMLQINPRKFKKIQNKSIPSPLRPKFRDKKSTNIYFLSQRKVKNEKKNIFFRRIKIIMSILIIGVGGYFITS